MASTAIDSFRRETELKKDRENRREKLVTREGYRNGVKVAGRGEHLGGMFGAQPCEVRKVEIFWQFRF